MVDSLDNSEEQINLDSPSQLSREISLKTSKSSREQFVNLSPPNFVVVFDVVLVVVVEDEKFALSDPRSESIILDAVIRGREGK